MEPAATALIGLDIDISAMVSHYPFAKGQSDASALEVLSCIEALEDHEYPLRKPGIDPYAMIGNDDLAMGNPAVELWMIFQFILGQRSGRYFDHRRRVRSRELKGIAKQIVKELIHL